MDGDYVVTADQLTPSAEGLCGFAMAPVQNCTDSITNGTALVTMMCSATNLNSARHESETTVLVFASLKLFCVILSCYIDLCMLRQSQDAAWKCKIADAVVTVTVFALSFVLFLIKLPATDVVVVDCGTLSSIVNADAATVDACETISNACPFELQILSGITDPSSLSLPIAVSFAFSLLLPLKLLSSLLVKHRDRHPSMATDHDALNWPPSSPSSPTSSISLAVIPELQSPAARPADSIGQPDPGIGQSGPGPAARPELVSAPSPEPTLVVNGAAHDAIVAKPDITCTPDLTNNSAP